MFSCKNVLFSVIKRFIIFKKCYYTDLYWYLLPESYSMLSLENKEWNYVGIFFSCVISVHWWTWNK